MTTNQLGCAEALRLLAEYLDREVSASDAERVRAHLHSCMSCYSRAEFERRLKESLAGLRDGPATPELEQRIKGLLQSLKRI